MKNVKLIALVLFVLCLPCLLVTFTVGLAANSLWLYQYGFEKFNISGITGLDKAQLERVARGLIRYFNSGEEYISLMVVRDGQAFDLFNEREIVHLKDVKGLFRLVYKVFLGALLYAIFYIVSGLWWWRDRRLGTGLFGGGLLTLGIGVILVAIVLADFQEFFLQFHLISFSNDFWRLDPSRDYLIMLFPQGFWYDAALFCTAATAFLAVVCAVAGWWLRRNKRRQDCS